MSVLKVVLNNASRIAQRLALPSRGWIGVDLGSRTIKLAQLERIRGQWRLGRRWLLTANTSTRITRAMLESGMLAQWKRELFNARRLFTGSNCAATLSMSLVEMRSLALPLGTPDELRDMVREELAAENEYDVGDFTFDFWDTPARDAEVTQVTALAVSTGVASRVGSDLLRAGYACQVLDGLPCVLARAAALAEGVSDQPSAILDLGDSAWTLVVAAQGRPRFTRVLRGEGMRSIMRLLEESLQLSQEQCMHLLNRYGVLGSAERGESAAEVIRQLVAPPLGELIEELDRTLAYITQQFPQLKPARLWLVGGGAVVRNLPGFLSESLRLPADAWMLPAAGEPPANDAAQFAAAAALSALKWEAQACM